MRAVTTVCLAAAALVGCGKDDTSHTITRMSDIHDVRAHRGAAGAYDEQRTSVARAEPLPVGVWAIADVEAAKQRMRPHYERMGSGGREENERSLQATVVEFRSDGSARIRTDHPWVMPGAWNAKGHEIVLRVIQGREATELTATTFRTSGDRLFVVSLGEELELKRVTWE